MMAASITVFGAARHQLDLIVAVQEVATCTAQLVLVASHVKAPHDSQILAAPRTTVKNVTQTTGIVVVTANDCSQQRLEDLQPMDLCSLT